MNFEKHNRGCCQKSFNNLLTSYFYKLRALHSVVMSIERTRLVRPAGLSLGIYYLLRAYFDREATDPRDKAYALLGLVT